MPTKAAPKEVFQALRAILEPYAPKLDVVHDKPDH
jgi:hypothetical protein